MVAFIVINIKYFSRGHLRSAVYAVQFDYFVVSPSLFFLPYATQLDADIALAVLTTHEVCVAF